MSRKSYFKNKTEKEFASYKENYQKIYERDYPLLKAAQEGSDEALTELLKIYDPFIRKFARKYLNSQTSHDLEDLYQWSRIGFVDGVRRFDLESLKEVRLTTFVSYRMMAEIQHTNRKYGYIVRPGSARTHIFDGDEGKTKDLLSSWVNLDDGIIITDPSQTPHEALQEAEEQERINTLVQEAMVPLTERQRDIINRRFFKDKPQTLEEIAKVYNLSRERIRQIIEQSLTKMRKKLKDGNLIKK